MKSNVKASIEALDKYDILEEKNISDINSVAYLCRHKKTGARIALISNDDENKVFSIGFRTPPKNSTGVAHIMEHSVLCGSKNFPVKDPFVELVKGSLNTFINAMTYSDKTVYPVASCNDKDFQNLLHVYMDAVFHPNIYDNESIFLQEGWRYEIDEETEELSVNGVVYNEMKGAFSSPDDVLEREIMNSLYPDTVYGFESGGDPDVIPKLTFDEFLDFHRKYYHPSNSYIYLYGNMDMAEKLKFIDEEYLSEYEYLEVDSTIDVQPDFGNEKYHRVVKEFPINDDEDEEENTFLSMNYSVADSLDRDLYIAFQIIDYALCSAPGAPLKEALVSKGLGKDVYSSYENGIMQPYFSIVSKGVSLSKEDEFLDTINVVLKDIVENGFDKKALLAGLNYYEFKYREADFGSFPKGLMYGLQIMDSWLYDDSKPFIHIEANDTFAKLRKLADEGYFEKLVKDYLYNSKHASVLILKPVKGLLDKKEKAWKEHLSSVKASMSDEQINEIKDKFAKLRLWQETEDSKENLEKIPLLKREDLKREITGFVNDERKIGDNTLLYHNIFTNGIGYLRVVFKCDDVPGEYFPYIGVLKAVLGLLNTQNYKYGDLFNEMNLITGGMAAVNNEYVNAKDNEKYIVTLEIKTKVFYENIEKAIELIKEIILTSDFTDTKRLYEIMAESKSRLQAQMISAGHNVAAGRALSYGSKAGVVNEILGGIPLYRLIADLEANFDDKKEDLTEKLTTLSKMIFRAENMMIDFVGEESALPSLESPIKDLAKDLYTVEVEKGKFVPVVKKKNEGFMTSGQVQYVCRAGNFKRQGLPYTGALKVLKVMMGYEYLWVNIRVKGGAYGCMCSFGKSGESYFVSYRDPKLKSTIDVYENAANTIEEFEADERTMTQYVIGTVSDLDVPMTPPAKGLYSMSAYLTELEEDVLKKEREEILSTSVSDIRALGKYIRAFMDEELLCVVGNSAKIKESKDLFMNVENLF